MRALGFDVKKADVQKVLRDYDREEIGKVTFDDFNDVSKCRRIIHMWPAFGGFLTYTRELLFVIRTGCACL